MFLLGFGVSGFEPLWAMGSTLLPRPKRQADYPFLNENRDPRALSEVLHHPGFTCSAVPTQRCWAAAQGMGCSSMVLVRGCLCPLDPLPSGPIRAGSQVARIYPAELPIYGCRVCIPGKWEDKRGRGEFTGARKQSPAWAEGGSGLQPGKGGCWTKCSWLIP